MKNEEKETMQLEHDLRQCLEVADRLKLHFVAIRINEALEELKSQRTDSGAEFPGSGSQSSGQSGR